MIAISVILLAFAVHSATAEHSCGYEEHCPKHEHYVSDDIDCPKTCGNRLIPGHQTAGACEPHTGCICDDGYVRPYDNATGSCIPVCQCAPIPTDCGINEEPSSCAIDCPPQTCESIYTTYNCPPKECKPGCNCKNNYLRDVNGVCILSDKCPAAGATTPPHPQCGSNEVLSYCAKSCPPQSCESLYVKYKCAKENCTIGCVCTDGYLRNSAGKCIPSQQCPKVPNAPILISSHSQSSHSKSHSHSSSYSRSYSSSSSSSKSRSIISTGANMCKGDKNAVHKDCPSACPLTCEQPNPRPCKKKPHGEPGCECKPGYVLSQIGGKCIKPEQCPVKCDDPNASYSDCTSSCPATCGDSRDKVCIAMCMGPGCECNPGYMLSKAGGKCVLPENCPDECKRRNAIFSECPRACQATCAEPETNKPCIEKCLEPGCVCDHGCLLTKKGGVCIRPEDCPGGSPTCGKNETYAYCKVDCPTNYCPVDDSRAIIACDPPHPCHSGCVCKKGYLRLSQKHDRCILASECPEIKCTRKHEVWNPQPLSCRAEGCRDLTHPKECNKPYLYDRPACVCEYGYYRNNDDICVHGSKCFECEKHNATFKECRTACPATCADPNAGNKPCIKICKPPGCECNQGYFLNEANGQCILPQDCPVKCDDPNASYSDCTSSCPATCGDSSDKVCIAMCMGPGCKCNPGYMLSKAGGKCVLPENCPDECKRRNATFSECPRACQATCAEPETNKPCIEKCLEPGCVCDHGCLLTKKGGVCIRPEDCPGGSPTCGKNESYAYCKVGCPTNYCPVDDSRAIIACDPPHSCHSGCVCKKGYLRLSQKHDRCILASECPEIKCTRKHEVWNPQPLSCRAERCRDLTHPKECNKPYLYDRPACVCQYGYYRNNDDICVHGSKCFECEKHNATFKECRTACPATCADPNAGNKPCILICKPPGCECKHGYVLNEANGKCILPQDCPVKCDDPNASYRDCTSACPATCGDSGDKVCIAMCMGPGCECNPGYMLSKAGGKCVLPENCPDECKRRNATFSECPGACQATCAEPETNKPCIEKCLEPGCVCDHGYLLTKEGGVCILPKDCPGGSPTCGKNETYAYCKVGCPTNYCPVDDSRAIIACDPPHPCPSGCVCKEGYLRLSQKHDRCILASECPAIKCTRKHEEWNPQPLSCRAERCRDLTNPKECDKPYLYDRPACVCEYGYYRNDDDICVHGSKCFDCEKHNATFTDCRTACPATCADPNAGNKPCILICLPPGCECNPGYVLNEANGQCILHQDCPVDCEKHNATFKEYRTACPATCADPNAGNKPCIEICKPPGCECNPGYVLNEIDGQCILLQDCPVDCEKHNATFKECRTACPATCADPDAGNKPCIEICKPPGCECNPGYVLNEIDGQCILLQDCPGPCVDPNASYSNCPSACPATCNDPAPKACVRKCMKPGCVCNPGYLLNEDTGECVLPEYCPDCYGDRNTTFSDCPSACSVTCAEPDSNTLCTPGCLEPGCVCKFGYVRTKIGGKCVLPEDCSIHCTDPNASFSICPYACPKMCGDTGDTVCIQACLDPGCECNPGYVLTRRGGTCVLPENCPVDELYCKAHNATYKECRSACPARCSTINSAELYCPAVCREPGCECNVGYVLDDDDRCILPKDCPATGNCTVPKECRRTCGSPNPPNCPYTPAVTNIDGCECQEGYILSEEGGKCIKIEECPDQSCNGDPHARVKQYPPPCPSTCNSPNQTPCKKMGERIGCVCEPGYIYSEKHSKCVLPNDCPGGDPCGPTAMFSSCNYDCPNNFCPQDDSRDIILCKPPRDCPSGCVCKLNHKRLSYENRTCIVSSTCPPVDCTRPHEVWDCCPSECLAENCEDVNNQPKTCNTLVLNCQPKCVCEKDHFRNGSDICIPAADCRERFTMLFVSYFSLLYLSGSVLGYVDKNEAKPPLQCGYNEIAVECRTICPPQNCEIAYTEYACGEPRCEPGCDCVPNHLRNGSGICILNDDCPYPTYPICGINEIARDCRRICPPQTCQSKLALYRCMENIPCEPGCDCVANYLRDASGVCIPSEECFATPTCSVPLECLRSCAYPNPPNCTYAPSETNIDGCNCQDGYILSDCDGTCIKIEDCPSCSGDPHAKVKKCPKPCPSTCTAPNAVNCKRKCIPIGCECNAGYIYSEKARNCVLPEECPGGNPCGPNSRFVDCKNSCPTDYCPVDDSRAIVACDPIPIEDCLSGCICDLNHKKLSHKNETCVVSSTCPPVECTRQNEVWSTCPECLAEMCSDADNPPSVCNTLVLNCQPKCICKENHFRNSDDLCVTREECFSDCGC